MTARTWPFRRWRDRRRSAIWRSRHGVSRKFVYAQAHKARVALDDAFLSATAEDEVLFELTVTKAWLRQVIVALPLICHSSYRGVIEFMRDLLGRVHQCGHRSQRASVAARRAGVINHEQDLSGIRVGLHDEIFQGSTPVLAGVDAASTYCYLLVAAEHRDADTWGVHLLDATRQGLKPDYTIADAGQGLRAGQKAAWGDTPCHGDVFHIQHQYEGLANTLSRLAKGARSRAPEAGGQDRSRGSAWSGRRTCHSTGARAADRGPGVLAGPRHPNAHPVVEP